MILGSVCAYTYHLSLRTSLRGLVQKEFQDYVLGDLSPQPAKLSLMIDDVLPYAMYTQCVYGILQKHRGR